MRKHYFLVLVLLLVVGVFVVETDGVKSVSVMQGDSVTLHTDLTEIPTDGDLRWKTQDDAIIAWIDGETNTISVPGNEESFKSRLKLDPKTGSLTITNIKTTDGGDYNLQFRNKSWSGNKEVFSVAVHGVFSDDGVKKKSVREGESVTLHTEITDIPEEDEIEWTFGPQDTALAKTDRQNKIIRKNSETFKDRVELFTKSGNLEVSNFKPEMSGLYKVKIIKSTYTLQKTFSVTLKDSREFSGSTGIVVLVICGASVLACAVAVFFYKKYRQSRQMCANAVWN